MYDECWPGIVVLDGVEGSRNYEHNELARNYGKTLRLKRVFSKYVLGKLKDVTITLV